MHPTHPTVAAERPTGAAPAVPEDFDPKQFLEDLGVGSFASQEIAGPDGKPVPLVDALRQCGGIGQAIKGTIEAARETAISLGVDPKKFDPSTPMKSFVRTMSDGEAMQSAHDRAQVDLSLVTDSKKK